MQALIVSPFKNAVGSAKRYLGVVALFSFFINMLMLTAPLYMLQVYDRVLTSRSEYTLLYLTLLAFGALATLAALDIIRSRILVRISAIFDSGLAKDVFRYVLRSGQGAQSFRDLDNLRTFLTGSSILALFDAPWVPIFTVFVYLLHPMLGHIALFGAVLLFVLALINERVSHRPLSEAAAQQGAAENFASTSSRNHISVRSMGMLPGLQQVWQQYHVAGLGFQAFASDRVAIIAACAKFSRFFLQVAILGTGAYLAIQEIVSPGVMIAASIIMGRALAPVESAINGWRQFLMAREAYARLDENLAAEQLPVDKLSLPPPTGHLSFERVTVIPPQSDLPVLHDLSFDIPAGVSVGITGPSAAGKSSLARAMVGAWHPCSGDVRLDQAILNQWEEEDLGPYIGYLPQEVELFPGTVAANIARFREADSATIIEAAKLADAHKLILELPDGYDTLIGAGGHNLSGGQRQRIGLIRALYGNPVLVVLDEPSSNLDAEGETAVRNTLNQLKLAGTTVIVIAHKPSIIGGVDKLMVMQKGRIARFGDASEIFPEITRRQVMKVEHKNTEKAAPVLKV